MIAQHAWSSKLFWGTTLKLSHILYLCIKTKGSFLFFSWILTSPDSLGYWPLPNVPMILTQHSKDCQWPIELPPYKLGNDTSSFKVPISMSQEITINADLIPSVYFTAIWRWAVVIILPICDVNYVNCVPFRCDILAQCAICTTGWGIGPGGRILKSGMQRLVDQLQGSRRL